MLKIPTELHAALSTLVANRIGIPVETAEKWIDDILEKGSQSRYFETVKPVATDFFAPILDALMPALKAIAQTVGIAFAERTAQINQSRDA